jgi:type II secretory pathway pseudopilin PulG
MSRNRKSIQRSRLGFTLLEAMITIVVLVVLVSLLVTGLRGSRSSARDLNRVAAMRTHVSMFTLYAADHKDYTPVFTIPSKISFVRCCGWVMQERLYFQADDSWHIFLSNYYASDDFRDDIFYTNVSQPREYRLWTNYLYSSTFLTDPGFWRTTTREGPWQWKPQTVSSVAHPSLKGLLINFAFPDTPVVDGYDGPPPPARIGFVDGSAQKFQRDALRSAYSGDPGPWRASDGLGSQQPVLHTIDGVRGVDVQSR